MIPYVKWYPSDWLASKAFRVLSFEQQGVYFALLNIAWQNSYRDETPPFLPNDPVELALELGMDSEAFNCCWGVVKRFFQDRNGKLCNPRQMEEWEKAKALIELRRKAGKTGGKGRPKSKQKSAHAKQVLARANTSQAHVSYPDPDTEPEPEDGGGVTSVLESNNARARDGDPPPSPVFGFPLSASSELDPLADQLMAVMASMNRRRPDCHTAEKLAAAFVGACGDDAPEAVAKLPSLLNGKKDPLAYLCKVAGDGGLKSMLARKPKKTRAEEIAEIAKRMEM